MNKYPIDKDFKTLTKFKSPLNFFSIWLSRLFWWLVPKGKKNPLVKTTKIKLTNPTDGKKFSVVFMQKKYNANKPNADNQDDLHQKSPCLVYFPSPIE